MHSDYLISLSEGIRSKELTIAVVGLGYVGLPTAISFHDAGYNVIGIDSSEILVNKLRAGQSPITAEIGISIPNSSRWNVTSDYASSIPKCDLAIVCVPTPVNEKLQPDIFAVSSAINSIISSRISGSLAIILESTVQPGTTRKCINDSISSNPTFSDEIFMAYCPERVSPGEGGFGVGEVSRVIGAQTPELTDVLTELYRTITSGEVKPVSSMEVAEASKLVENAQRDIDIAFANELAILLPKLGLDAEEVLSAASTKWNFHRHTPGIGVGGHCIPIDPHYYIEIAKKNGVSSAMSPAARELNSSMPNHSAQEIVRFCGGEAPNKVLVLGFSYKPNVSDSRETPVLPFIDSMLELGTKEILVWDPLIEISSLPDQIIGLSDPFSHKDVECVVLATAHDNILEMDWDELKKTLRIPRIFDGRRCLEPSIFLERGWSFHAIGKPLGEELI